MADGHGGDRDGYRRCACRYGVAGRHRGAGRYLARRHHATEADPLLAPPVIVQGVPAIGYLVWVRTPEPLGEGEPGRDLEISVPSLGLRSTVEREGTPPTRSSAGGWCVRVGLGGFKLKNAQSAPPRVVTVRLKGSDGLEQVAYARLQTTKGGSAAASGVPRAQSGCRKTNSGGPG